MKWKLFWRAYAYLLYFHFFIRRGKLAELHKRVREALVLQPTDATEEGIVLAINYAIAWLPVQTLCLQRSAVTVKLLREQGIPAQLVLGVKKSPFVGHAWVEVNGRTVNERWGTQGTYSVMERC